MRCVALLTLAALPAFAETAAPLPHDVNEAVAAWFSHCAAFSTEDDFVETYAAFACPDPALNMCRAAEKIAPGSGCFERLEKQVRLEEKAFLPQLDWLLHTLPKGFARNAIEREVERRAAPPAPRTCPGEFTPEECGVFSAVLDWVDLRALIRQRTP